VTALALADRVAATIVDDDVFVAHLPDGPILALRGTAAIVWRAVLDGPRETVLERVAEATGASAEAISGEVDDFVDDLLAQGLIVVRDDR
jgi:hypothetical protein